MTHKLIYLKDLDPDSLPGTVTSLIEFLQEKLLEVPKKYRNTTKIIFDTYEDHGSAYIQIRMYYSRKKTKAEEHDLIKEHVKKTKSIIEKELCLLKELKEKYEND